MSEVVESGVLRGAVLADRDAGFVIALRDREVSASRPFLSGFDVVAFYVPSRAALEHLVERWDRLQVHHEGVQDRGPYGAVVDVPDPDGTVLRFMWPGDQVPERFTGFEFDATGPTGTYDAPRLRWFDDT